MHGITWICVNSWTEWAKCSDSKRCISLHKAGKCDLRIQLQLLCHPVNSSLRNKLLHIHAGSNTRQNIFTVPATKWFKHTGDFRTKGVWFWKNWSWIKTKLPSDKNRPTNLMSTDYWSHRLSKTFVNWIRNTVDRCWEGSCDWSFAVGVSAFRAELSAEAQVGREGTVASLHKPPQSFPEE